ncbi:MAG: YfhO family protein [Patescibacteria group bacterium]
MKKFLPIIILLVSILFFFQPFFLQGRVPIPADTIVGLYHPFRDLYAAEYPNGVPYKNALLTDPVRQQYPWKHLAIGQESRMTLPLWNPYALAGTPLLATMQGGVLYPLNIVFFIMPFTSAWGVFIFSQQVLAGLFLFLYLRNLKLSKLSSLFGAITYSFCGFVIAWLEWGTLVHVAAWLPLILYCIDNIFVSYLHDHALEFDEDSKKLKNRKVAGWFFLYAFALTAAFFAGHIQTFFYLCLFTWSYFIARWIQYGRTRKIFLLFILVNLFFAVITIVQWLPTLRFISESARSIDLDWHKEGWFIPWQHLIQFIAPDFFGNSATLNYWGVWNYGEHIGYIGIIPLVFAFFALFQRHDRKTLFFGTAFFVSLVFALPTFFAMLPYLLQLPFLSTAQPTRLLFIIDFSLAVLAALGCEYYLRILHKKRMLWTLLFFFIIFVGLWGGVLFGQEVFSLTQEDLATAKRNLFLPTAIFAGAALFFVSMLFIKHRGVRQVLVGILLVITIVDLLRFGNKFTPFTDAAYLFPKTKILSFLQEQQSYPRIMTTDDRILPANFSVMYGLFGVDGYDPLYLQRYGELLAAIKRDRPDIAPPFGFNRIVSLHNYESRLTDLLGVKYILSLSELSSPKLRYIMSEGETRLYENTQAFPRAFFVENLIQTTSKEASIQKLFDESIDLRKTAIVEHNKEVPQRTYSVGNAAIVSYSSNDITVRVKNNQEGFLVFMDSFYPSWRAKICDTQNNNCAEIFVYRTNYTFRGVIVPAGEYNLLFYVNAL